MKDTTKLRRRLAALGVALTVLAAGPAFARKKKPIYPIDEVRTVDAATRLVVLPPKIELSSYAGANKKLDDAVAEVSIWLQEVAVESLREIGFDVAQISSEQQAAAVERIREIADQYVGSRRGPEADDELIRRISAGPGSCAVLVQHLEIELDKRGWWNSWNGQLAVGMSNSDLRGALLDCSSGEVLWRGELYYRDVPDVDSKKWNEAATGMYANLRIGR